MWRPRNRLTAVLCVLAMQVGLLAGTVVPRAAHAGTGPPPVSRWQFDEGSGQTAGDSAGQHPATLVGNAGWTPGIHGPSALSLDGAGDYADAGASVIDTSQSFTASGWVRLDRATGYQTLVSVDGQQVSGFYLQFRDDTRRFAFVKLPADVSAGAPAFPSATFDPVVGQWYQLTGVFDALSYDLNGKPAGSLSLPGAIIEGFGPSPT